MTTYNNVMLITYVMLLLCYFGKKEDVVYLNNVYHYYYVHYNCEHAQRLCYESSTISYFLFAFLLVVDQHT